MTTDRTSRTRYNVSRRKPLWPESAVFEQLATTAVRSCSVSILRHHFLVYTLQFISNAMTRGGWIPENKRKKKNLSRVYNDSCCSCWEWNERTKEYASQAMAGGLSTLNNNNIMYLPNMYILNRDWVLCTTDFFFIGLCQLNLAIHNTRRIKYLTFYFVSFLC